MLLPAGEREMVGDAPQLHDSIDKYRVVGPAALHDCIGRMLAGRAHTREHTETQQERNYLVREHTARCGVLNILLRFATCRFRRAKMDVSITFEETGEERPTDVGLGFEHL